MYQDYFGLTEAPFSIAPDPRYLYMSERHREALAHLLYGLNSDGAFILLSGDVGTGKTTVSRCLLEQIPDNTHIALVLNPKVSALELLQTVCDELHIEYPDSDKSIKTYVDLINRFLLDAHAQGENTVLLIDEAQNLDLDVLEQLRLLTNLETSERKLLQIILLGQPELLDILQRPELSQLSQRITARYHLTPLSESEMMSYVNHRLSVAGSRHQLFSTKILKRLYQLSHGIPRLVNVLCDRALLGTYVQNRSKVDRKTLDNAAKEVFGEKAGDYSHAHNKHGLVAGSMAAVVAMIAVIMGIVLYLQNESIDDQSMAEVNKEWPEVASSTEQATEVIAGTIQWPQELDRLRSNLLAFKSLFKRWQIDYQPELNGSPCFYAQTHNMGCFVDDSNLEKLRVLNRPVVLKLHDAHQNVFYAALLGLGQNVAKIELSGVEQTIALADIYKHWDGEFTLLWHQPTVYKKPIRPGDQGDDVFWLSQKLNAIDQTSTIDASAKYQDVMVDKVKQFQLQQGLIADGIVGVHTLIHINSKLGLKAPELLSDKS